MPSDTSVTAVYTDGACSGNPGPGGWAWAVPGGRWRSGHDPATTNQRMELRAALEAVTTLGTPLEVVSDSTYVVNCFKNRWWEGWEKRGWKNSQRQDVANQDLWRPLVAAYHRADGALRFRWVKGHSGDPGNDLVDRLAVAAIADGRGGEGDGPPARLGPADRPGRRGEVAPGSRCLVTGLRELAPAADAPGVRSAGAGAGSPAGPGSLAGPGSGRLAGRLTEILAAKRELEPALSVVTGLDAGAEQLGAEAARAAGVPYEVTIPFAGREQRWPAEARSRYGELLDGARAVTVLADRPPADRSEAGRRLAAGDRALEDLATEAVVVWDGEDRWVGRRIEQLQRQLGEDSVWVVEVESG